MKKIIILLFFAFIFFPVFVFAQCKSDGFSVVFINGIFNEEFNADQNKNLLENIFKKETGRTDVGFITGYNATHGPWGIADLVKAARQMYKGGYMDKDLTDILHQVKGELKTKKVLLVGHSQGTFYTNAAYEYLIGQEEVDKNSITVYNIATPADKVAGNGNYLTSSTDNVIAQIAAEFAKRSYAHQPLSPNIVIDLSDLPEKEKEGWSAGHSLSGVYLVEAADRIISEMQNGLNGLSSDSSDSETCFTPPKKGLAYYLSALGLGILDKTSNTLVALKNAIDSAVRYAYGLGKSFVENFLDRIRDLFAAALASNPVTSSLVSVEDIMSEFELEEDDNSNGQQDYSGTGGPNTNPDTEKSLQDLLDDIQERLDIINQQVQELVNQQNNNRGGNNNNDNNNNNQNQGNNQNNNNNNNNNNNQNNSQGNNGGSGGGGSSGGGGGSASYLKILISEIQIGPIAQRFVELYNPNPTDVSLTNWYLQRKDNNDTSWGSFVSSTNFSGKTIPANGYFLISRELTGSDILLDITLSEDNSLALKNPNGEISDKLGFGNAVDPELLATVNPESGKSIGRKFFDGTEQDTDNNSADFELDMLTPKSQNAAYVPPTPSDTTSPQTSFSLENTQIELSFPINFIITDPFDVVSPSGVSSYIFRWQEDGGVWQEDSAVAVSGSPASADFVKNFTGQDGKTYNFQVKAIDVAGNTNDWLPATPATTNIAVALKVLINEIQVSPVSQRFVELYNPNSTDIDLTGWYLQRKNQGDTSWGSFVSSTNFSGKTIPAKGYLLISRELVGSDILLDITLSDGNVLALKNPDRYIIDKVGYGTAPDYKVAPAQEPISGQSIQRKWDSVDNTVQDTGNNSEDFYIFGSPTPKAENPRYCLFNNYTFSENTTLKKSSCTYLFQNNNSINLGITVTAEPGAIIKFYPRAMLTVNGTLGAVGTATDKIIFTSFLDDEYGGDTNADGSSTSPSAGDWQTIIFSSTSTGAEFDYTAIQYGGSDLTSYGTVIKVDSAPISVKNSLIKNNRNRGIYLINSTATIDSNQFINNNIADLWTTFVPKAVDVFGGSAQIKNNYFKDNGAGISMNDWADPLGAVFGANTTVQNNDFEINWYAMILNTFNGPTFSGNELLGDINLPGTFAAILVNAVMDRDITLDPDLPYLFNTSSRSGQMEVPVGKTLTLNPGVILAFQSNWDGMNINGTLRAIGTPANPIFIRAYYYNRDWVLPGNWCGLVFSNTSTGSVLENVDISLGGAFYADGTSFGAAIRVDRSSILLKDSKVWGNANNGVWLENSASVIDNVQFLNHRRGDLPKALYIQGNSPEVKNSSFTSQTYGIYNANWINPNPPNETVPPTPNLHTVDPNDLEKNSFLDTDVADIYTVP